MSDTFDILKVLQEDVLALLLATPALANAKILADEDGDTESRVAKALAVTAKNRADKYGLVLIVLAAQVTQAEKNLPGPPLMVRLDVQTLEHVTTNRGPSGTGLRSDRAAMIALSTLHLYQFGGHSLYADAKPIEPLPALAGLESHSVTLYLRNVGVAVIPRPAAVEVSLGSPETFPTGNMILTAPGFLDENDTPLEGVYQQDGESGGRVQYLHSTGYLFRWDSTGTVKWELLTPGQTPVVYSLSNVATPDLATDWRLSSGGASVTEFTVTPEGGMIVSGSLTDGTNPVVFPLLLPAGLNGGRPKYNGNGIDSNDIATTGPYTLGWLISGNAWVLTVEETAGQWYSLEDVSSPHLVTTWTPVGAATGNPVVTSSVAADPLLTLTCGTPAAAIRYTTDGSYPAPAATLYTAPFAAPAAGTVIRAAAYVTGQPPGDVLEFTVTD